MPDASITSAATVYDRRKEADMNKQKVTILYERLSVEDDRDTESQSIENQRNILQEYAERNGLTPYQHIFNARRYFIYADGSETSAVYPVYR